MPGKAVSFTISRPFNVKTYFKIIFLLILSSLLYNTSDAQTSTKFDCNILESLFREKYIKGRLFVDKYKDKTITIIDTGHFFGDCYFKSIFGRQISFVSDSAIERSKRPFNFLIYQMSLSKGIYTIGLFNKYSGVQIHYLFKKKNGKYIFFKNESGWI